MEIQCELEETSTVKKKLKVKVPAEVASRELSRVAQDFRKQARVPGFRRGKAPLSLVKQRFVSEIRQEVIQNLIPESYKVALQQKQVRPLSQPEIGNLDFEEGQSLLYEASFEVLPEIELPAYRGLHVVVESTPFDEEAVERELDKLRGENSRLVAVEDRSVSDGDYVTINLSGDYLTEGLTRDPISEENIVVKVGDEHTHSAFNEALLAMSIGEEKTFEVDYPQDYPEEKLAGSRVRFTIRVTEIKWKELPQLNDDFARDLGEFDSLVDLQSSIRSRLQQQQESDHENRVRQKLMEALIESTSFEVPVVLTEDRIDRKVRDLAYSLASQGVDPSRANIDWGKVRDDFSRDAESEARSSLILDAIAEREAIEVSGEELSNEIAAAAEKMGQPLEKVRQYFSQENRMESLREQGRRRKALELVRQQARLG